MTLILRSVRRSELVVAAAARAARQRLEIGGQIRSARMAGGLSLATVGAAVGRSVAWVSRAERGIVRTVSFDELGVLAATVGLRLSVSVWPDAPALRDAGQLAVIRRFRQRIHAAWSWQQRFLSRSRAIDVPSTP